MARIKAVLILDPSRAADQLAYVSERAEILRRVGDQVWAAITDEQVDRFAGQGIVVQVHADADSIHVPAGTFDPIAATPDPPAGLRARDGDGEAYHLVQFIAPPDPAWIAAIAGLGGSFVGYIPADAGAFRLGTELIPTVGALPYVRWAGVWRAGERAGPAVR